MKKKIKYGLARYISPCVLKMIEKGLLTFDEALDGSFHLLRSGKGIFSVTTVLSTYPFINIDEPITRQKEAHHD